MYKFIKRKHLVVVIFCLTLTYCTHDRGIGTDSEKSNVPTKFHGEEINNIGPDFTPALPRKQDLQHTIDLTQVLNQRGILDFEKCVKNYHLIFLETSENCLIGKVDKVVVSDSIIYVLDTYKANALYVFRYDGSFLRAIGKKGKGPGEYIQVKDFYVDSKKGIVTVYDHFKGAFLNYSIKDGHYINQKRMQLHAHHFACIGDRFILEANSAPNDPFPSINKMALLVCSDDLIIESASIPKNDFRSATSHMVQIDDTNVSFSQTLNDTIYYTDGMNIIPMYYLRFNNKSRLPENHKKLSNKNLESLYRLFPPSKYSYFVGEYAENSTHLFFRLFFNNLVYYIYFNKTNGHLLSGTPASYPSIEPVNVMSFIVDVAPISNYEDMFIGVKSPTTVSWAINNRHPEWIIETVYSKSEALLLERYPQLAKVTVHDNPILVMFSLK